ncbi:MAG: alpha/beta fold hydrolase [Actinomycetota bacterium]|nr:alpha/beta fold hydrolase [Actinomycetota bacterium]MEC9058902.1 alpha/beta fold hydrolase [Actinomycetota bacterium]MED5361632.1 alpha/beta fold hydrolase [Actinomycetota bacterium]MEE3256989.1 alpha/beta fold hydrolase [Actinomycetota bacterium]
MYSYDETSRTLEADYQLHYHEAGEGPALILLHGSGPGVTGWTNFGANLPVFAEHFRTIILDMPGFGGSGSPEYDQQYPQVAADAVAKFMEGIGLDSAHLLGNSMGGNVASHVALNYPDRVQRMVMMGPGGLAVNVFGPSPNEGTKRLIEFMGDPSRERMIAWVETMVSDQALVTDELIDVRMENAMKPGVMESTRAIFGTFFKFPDPTPLWSRAHEIKHPTLITWGRDDRMLPFEGALFPFRQMPNADLHVFSNCGHWAQVERKDDFERVVIDYLLG